jgi:large subunit ribosomal protein L33
VRPNQSTRVTIQLVCNECKGRNYQTTKKRDQQIELKKFCKRCGNHTLHRESK